MHRCSSAARVDCPNELAGFTRMIYLYSDHVDAVSLHTLRRGLAALIVILLHRKNALASLNQLESSWVAGCDDGAAAPVGNSLGWNPCTRRGEP